jgi:hypothetical protein
VGHFYKPDPETDSRSGFRVRIQVQNSDPDPLAKQDPDTLTVNWFLSEDLDLPQERMADPKPVWRHFDTESDPWNRTPIQIQIQVRIQILLFLALAFKIPRKN